MGAEESRLALFPKTVALPADVEHVAVVQQSVQNGRSNDGIAQ